MELWFKMTRALLVICCLSIFLVISNAIAPHSDSDENNMVLDLIHNNKNSHLGNSMESVHSAISQGSSTILMKKRKKRKRKKLLNGAGEQQLKEWLHFLQSFPISQELSAGEDRGLNNSERRQAKLRYELHSSQQIRGLEFHAKAVVEPGLLQTILLSYIRVQGSRASNSKHTLILWISSDHSVMHFGGLFIRNA